MLDFSRLVRSQRREMTFAGHPATKPSSALFRWSLRIVLLAIAGILFLTLYPFRLSLRAHPGYGSPFLLQGWDKSPTAFDSFLNVLLFVPFGFGLGGLLRKRGFSRVSAVVLALCAGVLVSYCVEFTQFFIPDRDSGWDDVFTNSTGALTGALLFNLAGVWLLWPLQTVEKAIEPFTNARNICPVLICYFALWLGASARLQRASSLRDWDTDASLYVGRAADQRSGSAWQGKIGVLEFWNEALPPDVAARISAAPQPVAGSPGAISSFRFSGAAPFHDQEGVLPDLAWVPRQPGNGALRDPAWNGQFWLATPQPVRALIMPIQNSGHYSIHFQFVPARVDGVDAEIVSLSPPRGPADVLIRQESMALSFWFRNPLASSRYQLEWSLNGLCAPNEPRDVVFSYDGAKVWAYVNGKLNYGGYRIGAAAALAHHFRHIKTNELRGYRYIYYAVLFCPAGCMLGLAWRNIDRTARNPAALAILGIGLPAALLEIVLIRVGTQPVSAGDVMLSAGFSALGWLWMNLEGSSHSEGNALQDAGQA
jgi:VanZ family protein